MAKRRNLLRGIGVCVASILLLLILAVSTNFMNLGNAVRVAAFVKFKALEPVEVTQMIDGAIKGMVQELEDPYSVYLEPKEFQTLETHMKGSYGGLGIYVGIPEDTNRITVMAPIKGTPAARAGIKSSDEIWQIDGKDTAEMDIDTAVGYMKGDPGSEVILGIKRVGQEKLLDITLQREVIEIPSVDGKMLEKYPEIAYVNITMFNDHTGNEFGKVIEKLRKEHTVKGLILDLRNNPGGSLRAAVDTGSYFVPEGQPVVWLVDKNNTQGFPSAGNLINLPTVLLINKGSASASEIVAGAFKDVKAGTIVGETSFGKGIVQSVYKLADGAALKITTAKYLTPNKNDIHKKGIVPDVESLLPENLDPTVIYSGDPGKDPQLKKGLDILQGEM